MWEGGTRAVTFVHSPLLSNTEEAEGEAGAGAAGEGLEEGAGGAEGEGEGGRLADGLFHIVDWTPTLAAIAGVPEDRIQQLNLDGKNQKDFILNQGESARREFVYNIKTSPFKVKQRELVAFSALSNRLPELNLM